MEPTVRDDLVGRVVDHRYRVDRLIARGGMATVYLATDLRLDRQVALKVLLPAFAQDAEFLNRFSLEARSTARLSHPNVVAVHDHGSDGQIIYLVLEHVAGYTLRDLLNEHGPLTPAQALAVADPVLQALTAAHEAGFAHRDVKPENVLIGPRGTIKVADFGLVRALDEASPKTKHGMVIGTAAYVSPEHVSGEETDARSDVYGVGILLYEMLTGRPPYAGESALAVAYQHMNADVPRPSHLAPGIPTEVDELVEAATRRDRTERYASAEEFLDALRPVRALLPAAEPLPAALAASRETVVLSGGKSPTATARLPQTETAGTETAGTETAGAETQHESPTDTRSAAPSPPTPATRATSTPRTSRRPWVTATIVLSVLGILMAALGWAAAAGPLQRAEVPPLQGLPLVEAEESAAGVGLNLRVSGDEFSETIPADAVIRSAPQAGESTFLLNDVDVVLSKGPERYEVPRVRGMTPAEAADAVRGLNLIPGSRTDTFSDRVAEGLVVKTDPEAGSSVKRDTEVMFFVSKGPAPVPVPNVVGMPLEQATAELQRSGLTIAETTEEYSVQVPRGSIVSLSPAVGEVVLRGSTVDAVISQGPPPVEVPDVVDLRRNQAVAALEAEGFKVEVQESIVTPLNRVFSQDPEPGTSLPRGSTVTIQIF